MTPKVVLCADSFSLHYPEVLGLGDLQLDTQEWLAALSDGEEARAYVAEHGEIAEVWVLGCDDMEAINLAAAIKADCREASTGCKCSVNLVCDETEEAVHQMEAAGLDGILTGPALLERFIEYRSSRPAETGSASPQVPVHEAFVHVATEPVRVEPASPSRAGIGTLLPVLSASGGAGKSAVAVLVALTAAQRGRRVLLLDADFQFGDAALMLANARKPRNAGKAHSFDEVLDKTLSLTDVAHETADGWPALVGALSSPERAELCSEAFTGVLEEALHVFDVVVVNTSTWFSEVQAALIDRATRVLYVIDQRPSSVQAASRALGLCARCGMPTGAFTLVLNRVRRGSLYSAVDISCALPGFPVVELADGGLEVEECLASGRASDLLVAFNPLAQSIGSLTGELLGKNEDEGPEGGRPLLKGGPRRQGRRRLPWNKERDEPCPF